MKVCIFLLNGIPWWWPRGLPGKRGPLPLLRGLDRSLRAG